MPPLARLKPLAAIVVLAAAAAVWVFVFRSGWSNADWENGNASTATRGKTVYIGNKDIETTLDREKRLAVKAKDLRDEVGSVKKSVLGDQHKTRGDDIIPETPPLPEGFDFNPREACLQMKVEFPERYDNVDCMSDRYDNSDPWWKVGVRGQ
jgi:hypothetical protein